MEIRDPSTPMDEDSDGAVDPGTGRHGSQASPPASTPSGAAATGSGGSPVPSGSGATDGTPLNAAAANLNKRRRGLGVVTPTACTECRKKRAKCDGQKPCSRCKAQKDVECVYEQPVRQSKENLRTEIEILKRQQQSSENIFAALVQPNLGEDVLHRLRAGERAENIANWLNDAKTLASLQGRGQDVRSGSIGGRAVGIGAGAGTGVGAMAGGAPLAPFPRTTRPPVMDISTLTGFSAPPTAATTYSPMRQMHSPASVQGGGFGQPVREGDHGSPWSAGAYSTTSQTMSDRRESHPDTMAWSTDFRSRQPQHPQPLPPPLLSRSAEPNPNRHQYPQHGLLQQQPQHQQRLPEKRHIYQQGEPQMPPLALPRDQLGRDPRSEAKGNRHGPSGSHRSHHFQPGHAPDPQAVTDFPDMKIPADTWTEMTSDPDLVHHLLALYFCWEYPTFASLSKEHFLKDFGQGLERYCSPMLVNALLALGCRFSSRPNTRTKPDDPYTSGDHFFRESQRLFYEEKNHHTLTTIQALGIMSIREASSGRDSESWYYAGQSIRLAFEMGLHQVHDDDGLDDDELAVRSATFWGAFALDHAWSLATGSLPQCSVFPRVPPKPGIIEDIEASLWVPYTDDGTTLQPSCEQPSNVRSVYKCFCELSELVHQSLYILHSPGRPLTSLDLLSIYTQYLNWYDGIPEVLRLGHNFTPAVLFAHMYYQFAILLLFRPLIKLRIIGSNVLPREVCCQAADAIQNLLKSYSSLYTLRRTPSFVPYFVLTSSITHLAIGASASPSASTSSTATPASLHVPTADPLAQAGNQHSPAGQHYNATARPPAPGQQQQSTPQQTMRSPSQQSPDQVRLAPNVVEAIRRGISDLTEMAPCHHFAVQALNILRYLAKKWNIPVNMDELTKKAEKGGEGGDNGVGGSQRQSPQEQKDMDRVVRPVTSSRNFFAPMVQDSDYNCVWGSNSSTGAGVASRAEAEAVGVAGVDAGADTVNRKAEALENPLFWPFPMQGRPMLPMGSQLEEAGFALL